MDGINSLLNVNSDYIREAAKSSSVLPDSGESFDSIFQSALKLVKETNDLSNAAELEEIRFAMGDSESIHDLTAALEKAEVAIQYTVAVRDKVLEAYKEIMNMQI